MNKKVITIIGADIVKGQKSLLNPQKTDLVIHGDNSMSVCDGYHTFEELYDHRITLFIALCRVLVWAVQNQDMHEGGEGRYEDVWRSKTNGDGTIWDGWFVMGIGKEAGKQITYHLPLSRWDETDFVDTMKIAPEFDGHSSSDVLERLKNL